MAKHVRQLPLNAVVVETQALMIEAEEVEYRRVEIVDACHVLNGLVAELVPRAVTEAALHARAGKPTVKPFGLWSRAKSTFVEEAGGSVGAFAAARAANRASDQI